MTANRPPSGSPDTGAEGADAPRRKRNPRAFRIDEGSPLPFADAPTPESLNAGRARVFPEAMPLPAPVPAEALPPTRRRTGWGKLLLAALGGLVTLAIGLAIDAFVRELFARTDWLGWLGLGLAALAALAALAIVVRELSGLWRLKQIDRIREDLAQAADTDRAADARTAIAAMTALYASHPETAKGRAALSAHAGEVIDGRDLVILAERDVLRPLDARARRIISDSAKRVSVVTAVSPRAFVDLAFVAIENLRMIRKLAELYGGRPGLLGFLRLARNVLGHLAVTGGMAAGDSLVQQVVGHGLAARLSARLGEGVINGLLTARIGAAAMDVCRPAPYIGTRPPRMTDFIGELTRAAEKAGDANPQAAGDGRGTA